jgi:hypothetical protein
VPNDVNPSGRRAVTPGPTSRSRPSPRTGLLLGALAIAVGAIGFAFGLPERPSDAPLAAEPDPEPAPPAAPPAQGFEDVTREAGIRFRMEFLPGEQGEKFKINFYDHGCGVAVADYDGDGDDDVYFCNQMGSNALYRNEGGRRFTDVTAAAGRLGLENRVSVAATFADADGDGDQDLYVTTTRGGNVFWRNQGDGTFEDATEKAGLRLVAHSEQPTFFDADGDRDLDLLVTNTAQWTTDSFDARAGYYVGPPGLFDLIESPREENRFYRNRGDGTFEDATKESGLAGPGWCGDTAVFDFDEDGDLDVFVANMFGKSLLYRNDGKARFEDATAQTLGKTPWGTVGAKAFDYDGDGRLDLYLVDMHSDMWMDFDTPMERIPETAKYDGPFGPQIERGVVPEWKAKRFLERLAVRPDEVVFGNSLHRALGGGKFEETSDRAGAETLWPWGIAAADFDGDGWEDAFLPSGMGYPYGYLRSPLLVNDGDGTFTDRSRETGIDPPEGGIHLEEKIGGKPATRSSRSAAVADFDGDGRMDLVVNNFNDVPFLLMNRWPKRNHVAFRLTGTAGHRDAIGAVVRLTVGKRVLVRQVHAAGGYLAQSSRTLHFGLGDAASIDRCEIRWPGGAVQVVPPPAINRLHEVVEPAK